MTSVRKRGARGVTTAPPPPKAAKKNSAPEIVGVAWNSKDCAPQLNLSRDSLSVTGEKGYRMVRANSGVREGHWYFELEVLPPTSVEPAHVRVGWAAATADIQGPVGYDQWSYAYRDVAGSKLHKSERYDGYGESFGPGDVVGCAIHVPPSDSTIGGLGGFFAGAQPSTVSGTSSSNGNSNTSQSPPEFAHLPPGAHIRFYKNGVDQGVAFEGVPERTYYPAVSLYGPAKVRVNFGPVWLVPPPGIVSKSSSSIAAGGSSKTAGVGGGIAAFAVPYSLSAAPKATAVGVPAMRPVADLKPMPKAEAAENAQLIAERRAHLNINGGQLDGKARATRGREEASLTNFSSKSAKTGQEAPKTQLVEPKLRRR